jgi:hypothetical protein
MKGNRFQLSVQRAAKIGYISGAAAGTIPWSGTRFNESYAFVSFGTRYWPIGIP